MPRKKAQQVTLVGVRGAKLPVSECLLVSEDADSYVVQAVRKTRGRAANKLATYVLPKSMVQYYYSEEDIEGDVDGVPVAAAKAAPRAAAKKPAAKKKVAKKAAAPKKRGRPKGSKNKPKEGAAAPKKRGRPKGSKNKSKDAGSAKANKAASLFDESF